MPDIMPIPWRERALSDIGFPAKSVLAAREEGIMNLGDLVRSKKTFVDFPGVGAVTATKIEQALNAYMESDCVHN
jgi:hypothetical protein